MNTPPLSSAPRLPLAADTPAPAQRTQEPAATQAMPYSRHLHGIQAGDGTARQAMLDRRAAAQARPAVEAR